MSASLASAGRAEMEPRGLHGSCATGSPPVFFSPALALSLSLALALSLLSCARSLTLSCALHLRPPQETFSAAAPPGGPAAPPSDLLLYDGAAGGFQVPCSLNGLAAAASGGALGWVFGFGASLLFFLNKTENVRGSGGACRLPPLSTHPPAHVHPPTKTKPRLRPHPAFRPGPSARGGRRRLDVRPVVRLIWRGVRGGGVRGGAAAGQGGRCVACVPCDGWGRAPTPPPPTTTTTTTTTTSTTTTTTTTTTTKRGGEGGTVRPPS